MMLDNDTTKAGTNEKVIVDWRSFLTWVTTSILIYGFLSGLAILLLPFGAFTQYSIVVHSAVGILSCVPICWLVYLHWRRRNHQIPPMVQWVAGLATLLLAVCILAGVVLSLQAAFGTWVTPAVRYVHLVAGLLLGLAVFAHLVPILLRYRNTPATVRRPARHRFVAIGISGIAVLFAITYGLAKTLQQPTHFQAFDDDYSWTFDGDRPFWPSQASISNPPWQKRLHESLRQALNETDFAAVQSKLSEWKATAGGPITALRAAIDTLDTNDQLQLKLQQILADAEINLKQTGAIRPGSLTGSAGCGASGCHDAIYKEWLPSAHGFAATDILFRRVQVAMIRSLC